MNLDLVSFVVLAVASIASGIGVIAFKNAVHSALSLIMTILFLAIFYLQLGAMFISVVQILIYAGAIMVLFLFVVTMLAPDRDEPTDRLVWQRWVGVVLGLVLAGAFGYLIYKGLDGRQVIQASAENNIYTQIQQSGDVQAFGQALFHGFLFPFELTSLLIVVAIVGALVFGRRTQTGAPTVQEEE
jgi:NADH-quinone oxidoreductase subunit J